MAAQPDVTVVIRQLQAVTNQAVPRPTASSSEYEAARDYTTHLANIIATWGEDDLRHIGP
jgi:hypothetical protein